MVFPLAEVHLEAIRLIFVSSAITERDGKGLDVLKG